MDNQNKKVSTILEDPDDYSEAVENDNGEDYEATIDEEELVDDCDYAKELKDLEDEGEMSIEELRKRYGYPPEGCLTQIDGEDEQEEIDEEFLDDSSLQNNENEEQPILDEQSGSCVKQNYIKTHESNVLDEEDDDYIPPDPWRREVRIDPLKFQAEIPTLLTDEERQASLGNIQDDSILLWSWDKSLPANDEQIDEYLTDVVDLRLSHEQFVPPRANKARDDEDALCAFLRNNCNPKQAKDSFPFPRVNAPLRTVRADALSWDETEAKTFEESLEMYGKDFSLIKRLKLPYRKVGELVEYYYQWKMTPAYRVWREAHPAHVPVVQPHVSAAVVAHAQSEQNQNQENTQQTQPPMQLQHHQQYNDRNDSISEKPIP